MSEKLSIKQQLLEAIKFVKGKDDDYFYKKFGLITVTKQGAKQYKLTPGKKTAGLAGHAAKHLIEIDREYMANIIYKIKGLLLQHAKDDNAVINVYKDGRRGPMKGDVETYIKKAPFFSIANTLDMVNDKRELGEPLEPIEQEIAVYLDKIANRYGHYIEQAISKADNLDKITDQAKVEERLRGDGVVCFEAECFKHEEDESGVYQTIYIDLDAQTVIFASRKGVHSAYRLGASLQDAKEVEKMSKDEFLSKFVHKFQKTTRFLNLRTMRALFEVTGTEY